VESILSVLLKLLTSKAAIKLVVILGGAVVAAVTFISDFFRKTDKRLVDPSTNRTEDIHIDDVASVRSAIDSLYESMIETNRKG
jgi:hypothetical protein